MNESTRMEQARQRLANAISRHAPIGGTHQTAVPALTLLQAVRTSEPLESVYKPSICIVAQGAKTAALADHTYKYDPMTYLVTSVELPIFGKIVEASPDITINCIAPGQVSTELFLTGKSDELVDSFRRMNAFGRLGEPEDIANAVELLSGDKGRWITGQTLRVNGGFN